MVVGKEQTTERQQIRDTVRRTDVAVETDGDINRDAGLGRSL